MIVVATDDEFKLACERFKGHKIKRTGVGGTNVVAALRNENKSQEIINFGYAGSNIIPIGTEVKIKSCKLYHPNVEYKETTFELKDGEVPCYTSNDFVLKTEIKEPCVFDMELAYIMALGFKNVKSIKIVSDNLSLKEYEENI